MSGGSRLGAGRKRIGIDLRELEKLCTLHCTDEEIAAWFGISTRTIEKRRKQPEFAEVMQRGKAKGRISVRRAQMKLLEHGNPTMAIWLGKQHLGQRDVMPLELSGPNQQPIKFSLEALDASIREFGRGQPIVVDSEGVTICGHVQLLAAPSTSRKLRLPN